MCRSLTIDRGTPVTGLDELAGVIGRDRVRIDTGSATLPDWNCCLCPLDIEATAAAAGLVKLPYFDEARDPAEADLRQRRPAPARIFLDDERAPPPGDWWVCRSISDFAHAVACADASLVEVWLDYDLPLTEHRMTGLDAAHLLVAEAKHLPPGLTIRLHSWNPRGVGEMRDYLAAALPAAQLVEKMWIPGAPDDAPFIPLLFVPDEGGGP